MHEKYDILDVEMLFNNSGANYRMRKIKKDHMVMRQYMDRAAQHDIRRQVSIGNLPHRFIKYLGLSTQDRDANALITQPKTRLYSPSVTTNNITVEDALIDSGADSFALGGNAWIITESTNRTTDVSTVINMWRWL